MKKEIMEKWVSSLRSGEYKKGTGELRSNGAYCCLGILTDLYQKDTGDILRDWDEAETTKTLIALVVRLWAGISLGSSSVLRYEPDSLAYQNDNDKTFDKIANRIETEWETY